MEVSLIWSPYCSYLLSQAIVIITDRVRERLHKDQNWVENEDIRLNPESIAKVIILHIIHWGVPGLMLSNSHTCT